MFHSGIVSEWLLVTQVVGYTASTVIVLLLAALVRRAARFEDARPYALLVWAILLWNAGNLVAAAGVLLGVPFDSGLVGIAMFAAFCGAALSPAGALIMWHGVDRPSGGSMWLAHFSLAVGMLLIALLGAPKILGGASASEHLLWNLLAYHVALFFGIGGWKFYRSGRTTLASRLGIGMAGLGALVVGVSVFLEKGIMPSEPPAVLSLGIGRQVATHVMTLGALLFLARFRLADVFIRQSLRMIAAVLLGVMCASVLARLPTDASPLAGGSMMAVTFVAGALAIAALLLSFAAVDRLIVSIVDRWLFRQPDYERALTRLRDELAGARDRTALHEHAARFVRETMALQHARVTPAALAMKDANVVIVPVPTADGAQDLLEATPRWDHPTLLGREVQFLRAAATTLGHRLDAVSREQEEIDRLTREADLQRQVSEATLRALQAQINPHFLFNTLNTIADLIQEDPAGAEAMTLRLAEVFSHVLTNGHRPLRSVRDEMEFLRTYLTIEEARFGDRLHVTFVVEPAAEHAIIPSLILQPIVENALKHGLSRKVGSGHLTISAICDHDDLLLSVEDDGVGPSAPSTPHRATPSTGVGLRNIAERLDTLYADRASVRFEPASRGGTVVTVRLPLHAHDQEPVG